MRPRHVACQCTAENVGALVLLLMRVTSTASHVSIVCLFRRVRSESQTSPMSVGGEVKISTQQPRIYSVRPRIRTGMLRHRVRTASVPQVRSVCRIYEEDRSRVTNIGWCRRTRSREEKSRIRVEVMSQCDPARCAARKR